MKTIISLSAIALFGIAACSNNQAGQDKKTLGDLFAIPAQNSSQSPNEEIDAAKKEVNQKELSLLKACIMGDEALTRTLLSQGVSPNRNFAPKDRAPVTPLIAATAKGHKGISRLLLAYGADPWVNHRGYNVLDFSIYKKLGTDLEEAIRTK